MPLRLITFRDLNKGKGRLTGLEFQLMKIKRLDYMVAHEGEDPYVMAQGLKDAGLYSKATYVNDIAATIKRKRAKGFPC